MPGATPWRDRRPAPARPWASPSRSSSGWIPTQSPLPRGARPGARPASSRSRCARSSTTSRRRRACKVKAVYGGTNVQEQAKGVETAHVLIATPGRLDDLASAQARRPRRRPGSWCSTRPTGCSTWGSSRRSTGSCGACRRTARRCSSRPRSTARSAGSPRSTRATRCATRSRRRRRPDRRGGRPPVRPGARRTTSSTKLIELAHGRGRAHARVREHEAGGRLARAPAEGAGRAGARAARRHAPGGPRPGAEAVRGRPRGRPGRHRRRGARPGPRRHHARRELRPAAGRQGLRPPRRPHGARRAQRARASRSSRRTSRATSPGWPRASTCTRSSSRRA